MTYAINKQRVTSQASRTIGIATLLALLLTGCVTQRVAPVTPTIPVPAPPIDTDAIGDAIPRVEPLSKRGNPAFYDVLGKRYFVISSASGYVERGVASWYGPGFHKEFTSNGEPYDMYGMTAAHKTLPLPCFVRVTNLANGKSVVVRVNDRGPFKDGRIIDLSHTAAAKLDMLRAGTALVEVRVVTPNDSAQPPALQQQSYVQAGAFGDVGNAERLAAQLRSKGYTQALVHSDTTGGRVLHRVRIGPVTDVANFDRIVAELKQFGISDARLANE